MPRRLIYEQLELRGHPALDYVNIRPISGPVIADKQGAKRHYGVHPYFTKRSWSVVQNYISTYTAPGDIVLDPFGGAGVTAVEALVLDRRAIHVDISPFANFIADSVAIGPVDLEGLTAAFRGVEEACKSRLAAIATLPQGDPQFSKIPYWYPRDYPLPNNSDARYVHELFTPRQLLGLALLRDCITNEPDKLYRQMLMFAFSGTLAKVNRTFVSASGRKESRGGSTIFSIYRYHVPKQPVELEVWEQFEMRFRSLFRAKHETNSLVGTKYTPETFQVLQASATDLRDRVAPESVDYIFTDPPYGGHIAYLDLSTMWQAWLQLDVPPGDRHLEVIEGGDLKKSKQEYMDLLGQSIAEMFRVLKQDRWLSIVFSHKDPAYWDAIVGACERAGFNYVNTAVQPIQVIWSMHKKRILFGCCRVNLSSTFSRGRTFAQQPCGVLEVTGFKSSRTQLS